MVELRLPYPVSANRYWRNVVIRGASRTLRSAEANAYRDAVRWTASEAGVERPMIGPVLVALVLHPVEPQDAAKRARKEGPLWHLGVRCMNVDNAIKITLDALNGVAYADDDQIVTLLIDRGAPAPGGALVVRVKPVSESALMLGAPQMNLSMEVA